MKFLSSMIFVLSIVGQIVAQSEPSKNFTLNLYYEILCPDCIQFVNQQVAPVYKSIGSYFNVEFVPYGNAETNTDPATGNVTIRCQHGQRECVGNIMHACALKYLPVSSRNDFIFCTMKQSDPSAAGPKCAKKLKLNFTSVANCAKSNEGFQLLKANGEITDKLNPPHQFVPWILFNGIYNEQDMGHAQNDLLPVICKYLPQPTPRQCNEI